MARTSTRLTCSKAAVIASMLVIAGCTGAVVGQTPTAQFDVPIDLKSTYDRALAQTKYCLVSNDDSPLTAEISPDQLSANITVRMKMSGTLLADIKMRAQGAEQTNVLVNMWGVNIWNQTAVDAMKAAIEFGVPSCVDYFPTTPPPRRSRR